jgi:hypothetical protein
MVKKKENQPQRKLKCVCLSEKNNLNRLFLLLCDFNNMTSERGKSMETVESSGMSEVECGGRKTRQSTEGF